jgi:hypothetical protein
LRMFPPFIMLLPIVVRMCLNTFLCSLSSFSFTHISAPFLSLIH